MSITAYANIFSVDEFSRILSKYTNLFRLLGSYWSLTSILLWYQEDHGQEAMSFGCGLFCGTFIYHALDLLLQDSPPLKCLRGFGGCFWKGCWLKGTLKPCTASSTQGSCVSFTQRTLSFLLVGGFSLLALYLWVLFLCILIG